MIYILYFFVLGIGLCIGSFINCLAWRLYHHESILWRSFCPHCRHKIAWYDNVPLLSFFLLRRKCRNCRKPISWQYPLVELATGLLFLLIFIKDYALLADVNQIFNSQFLIFNYLTLFRDWFFVSILVIIFLMDFKWYVIMDQISLPAIAVMLFLNIYLGAPWLNLLISGVVCAGFFLIQYLISKGKWIGGGDIRLGLLLGVALGSQLTIVTMMSGYILGAVIGLTLLAFGKKHWGSKLPLGVFLTAGAVIAMFYGMELWQIFFRF